MRAKFEMAENGGSTRMTKKSPAVARVVAVLSFFLEHPQQAFTLTQVVKSLRLSRATTHTILLGLVDAGFLYRRPDKSYLLGPVLHSLAAGAQRYFTPLSIANLEMRAIADELDVVASALFAEGDEVVVRERAASVKHLGWGNMASRHYALLPAGSVFLMPLSDAEVAAKIAKARPPLGEREQEDVHNQLEFACKHGFIVGLANGDLDPTLGQITRFVPDIADGAEVHVTFMVAPVVGASGEVVLAISLQGLSPRMSKEKVLETGRRLRETCQRVTDFIIGKRNQDAIL
jgi:DNA-binding IclR family transcriptional regulator